LCGSASELATLRSTTSKHDVNGGGGVNGLERRASSTDPVHDHDHHIDVFVAAPTPVANHPSTRRGRFGERRPSSTSTRHDFQAAATP